MSAPWGDAKSWETADDRCNSDLDTAAIRDRYRGRSIRTDGRLTTDAEHVIALCDALDEARAQVARLTDTGWEAIRAWEVAAIEWKDHAKKAEAQVTAVRAVLDGRPRGAYIGNLLHDLRAALDGDVSAFDTPEGKSRLSADGLRWEAVPTNQWCSASGHSDCVVTGTGKLLHRPALVPHVDEEPP